MANRNVVRFYAKKRYKYFSKWFWLGVYMSTAFCIWFYNLLVKKPCFEGALLSFISIAWVMFCMWLLFYNFREEVE